MNYVNLPQHLELKNEDDTIYRRTVTYRQQFEMTKVNLALD